MAKDPDPSTIPDYDKWQLSNAEWKERLSPEAYAVLRKEATERAGTSPLNDEKRDGIYACAGCGFDLFKSETKFESGTGWPSFASPLPAVEVGANNPVFAAIGGTEVRCGSSRESEACRLCERASFSCM